MEKIKSKKAGDPITNILPTVVITIIVTIIILILVYTFIKGGTGFLENPPIKSLPV